jgi:hypothetical protein
MVVGSSLSNISGNTTHKLITNCNPDPFFKDSIKPDGRKTFRNLIKMTTIYMLAATIYMLAANMHMLVATMYMLVATMYMLVATMYMLVATMYIVRICIRQQITFTTMIFQNLYVYNINLHY